MEENMATYSTAPFYTYVTDNTVRQPNSTLAPVDLDDPLTQRVLHTALAYAPFIREITEQDILLTQNVISFEIGYNKKTKERHPISQMIRLSTFYWLHMNC